MRVRMLVFVLMASLFASACGNDSPDNSATDSTNGTTSTTSNTSSTSENETTTTVGEVTEDTNAEVSCPDAAPIPASATDVSEAPIDFDGDGDGQVDRLVTYQQGDQWWLGVEWAAGGSSRAVIDEAFMGGQPLGGYDLNGDGLDEAFVSIFGPASGVMVGIFYADGCDIAPVLDETAAGAFVFPVTGSIGFFSGASCNSIGDISLISGQLVDAETGEYEASEVPYSFDPATGTLTAGFGDGGSVGFDEIGELSTLACGSLADAL